MTSWRRCTAKVKWCRPPTTTRPGSCVLGCRMRPPVDSRTSSPRRWSRRDRPFVPPPYPYDAAQRPQSRRSWNATTRWSISRSERHSIRHRLQSSKRWPPATRNGRTRRAWAPRPTARRRRRWFQRRFDVEVPADKIAATVGSKEFVALLPQLMSLRTPERDTILFPAISYPELRDGRDARRMPCGVGPVPPRRRHRSRCDRSCRRRAGAAVVEQQPRQPDRPTRRPRSRSRMGAIPRRAGVLRRVLHRVHVGVARSHDPRTRIRGCDRCPLPVQAIELRRSPGRLLRR